jgi:hypothetical protein
MTYDDDYVKNRDWVVDWADPDANCQKNDRVEFKGSHDLVEIFCQGKHVYGPGRYDGQSRTIEGETGYKISIIAEKPFRIELKAQGGVITGSWTAEDHMTRHEAG